jgi:hypothetical protein
MGQQSSIIRVTAKPDNTANATLYFSAFGKLINGADVPVRNMVGNFVSATSSITGPTDSKEGLPANYIFTANTNTNYPYNLLDNVDISFLDITNAYVLYNGAQIATVPIVNGVINKAMPVTITASCPIPQIFTLALQSGGSCNVLTPISSAQGQSVVECNSTGTVAITCSTIYTDNASISIPPIMNTCTVIPLTATGHVDHLCNDATNNCPAITQIIARVYDLSGILTFDGSQSNASLTVSSSLNMTLSPQYANGNGIAWVANNINLSCDPKKLNIDNFSLSASILIKGGHTLPPMSNINLRVEFDMIDANGTVIGANSSKGIAITVYDPKPSFDANIVVALCGYAQVYASESKGAPGTKPVIINQITYPALPNIFYTIPSQVNTPAVDNTITTIQPDAGQTAIFKAAYPKCLADLSYYTEPAININYSDYYASCDDKQILTYSQYNGLPSTTVANMPTIVFHPAVVEQSLTSSTTWSLMVENKGSRAGYVTLKIQPDALNQITMEITSLSLNKTRLSPSTYKTIGNTVYVSLGSIDPNTQVELDITAKAQKCLNSGNSLIDISGVVSCADLSTSPSTTIASVFASYDCGNLSTQLQMENMSAELQAVETFEPGPFEMCKDIGVSVKVSNIGRADLSNLGFWFEQPNTGTTIVDNKVTWTYNGTTYDLINGTAPQNLIINNTDKIKSNTILSDQIIRNSPIDETASTLSPNQDIILDFNIQIQCSPDLNSTLGTVVNPVKMHSSGLSNCGEPQEYILQFVPPLKGFDDLNDLSVSTPNPSNFSLVGTISTGKLQFTVSNTNASNPLTAVSLFITLPDGVTITSVNGDPGLQGFIMSATANGVLLTLPQDQSIVSGSPKYINLQLQDSKPCPDISYVDIAGALTRTLTGCGTSSCPVTEQQIAVKGVLNRVKQPLPISITGKTDVCATNTTATLTASGADSYVWSDGTNGATVTVSAPTTTYTVTGTTALGCIGTATTTISYHQLPTVTINAPVGSIQFADWSTQGTKLFTVIQSEGTTGTWAQVSGPTDGGCGSYTWSYTIQSFCGPVTATITFDVINCCILDCPTNDLVITDMPGYTTYDVTILQYYIAHPGNLQKQPDCSYILTSNDACIPTVHLNACFLKNADSNNDGKIDAADVAIFINLVAKALGN